jgi:ATP-dependent 26S proteasome regulatory subunit
MSLSSPVQAICSEAGLLALRERRMKVNADDFSKSKENVLYRKKEGVPEGLALCLIATCSRLPGMYV